jgi:hypothetical protein
LYLWSLLLVMQQVRQQEQLEQQAMDLQCHLQPT